MTDGRHGFVSKSVEGGSRGRVEFCFSELLGRSLCVVGGREFGDRAVIWEKLDRLGNAFSTRGWDVEEVVPVVLVCRADVPAIYAVWGPLSSLVRDLMDEDLGTWGSKGGIVEIEGPI